MSERLLTARELAGQLGFKAGTIVDWYEAGEIPGFKLGGRLRFRLSEVEAWMETHRGKADPSREQNGNNKLVECSPNVPHERTHHECPPQG